MNLIGKYKPKRLADLVFPNDKIRFYLEDMADGLVINNLLLTGTQGSQKTTVAKLLPELIEGYSPFVNVVRGETDLNIQKALVPLHNLVNFGGKFIINVPYDLSYGAWQDPTHIRAFNQNSWLYYTDWFWYLGWFNHKFDLVELQFMPSPSGHELIKQNVNQDSILSTPRAIDSMHVVLVKRETTPEEKSLARSYSNQLILKKVI